MTEMPEGFLWLRSASRVLPAGAFYTAVLEHAVEWDDAFATGMSVVLPFAERRQVRYGPMMLCNC